jgi:hypothetical protein
MKNRQTFGNGVGNKPEADELDEHDLSQRGHCSETKINI